MFSLGQTRTTFQSVFGNAFNILAKYNAVLYSDDHFWIPEPNRIGALAGELISIRYTLAENHLDISDWSQFKVEFHLLIDDMMFHINVSFGSPVQYGVYMSDGKGFVNSDEYGVFYFGLISRSAKGIRLFYNGIVINLGQIKLAPISSKVTVNKYKQRIKSSKNQIESVEIEGVDENAGYGNIYQVWLTESGPIAPMDPMKSVQEIKIVRILAIPNFYTDEPGQIAESALYHVHGVALPYYSIEIV
jgi:hypothetical protein